MREKAEKYFLDPLDFADEEDFMDRLREIGEAWSQPTPQSRRDDGKNSALEKSLRHGKKSQVLSALRKGFPIGAKLTVGMRISMDPQDGAGAQCVYILERTRHQKGEWVLAYTSPDAAKKDGRAGSITGGQEALLRSIVKLPDIDGVLLRSGPHSFCLDTEDITELLAAVELRQEAWDAICTRRTIAI